MREDPRVSLQGVATASSGVGTCRTSHRASVMDPDDGEADRCKQGVVVGRLPAVAQPALQGSQIAASAPPLPACDPSTLLIVSLSGPSQLSAVGFLGKR